MKERKAATRHERQVAKATHRDEAIAMDTSGGSHAYENTIYSQIYEPFTMAEPEAQLGRPAKNNIPPRVSPAPPNPRNISFTRGTSFCLPGKTGSPKKATTWKKDYKKEALKQEIEKRASGTRLWEHRQNDATSPELLWRALRQYHLNAKCWETCIELPLILPPGVTSLRPDSPGEEVTPDGLTEDISTDGEPEENTEIGDRPSNANVESTKEFDIEATADRYRAIPLHKLRDHISKRWGSATNFWPVKDWMVSRAVTDDLAESIPIDDPARHFFFLGPSWVETAEEPAIPLAPWRREPEWDSDDMCERCTALYALTDRRKELGDLLVPPHCPEFLMVAITEINERVRRARELEARYCEALYRGRVLNHIRFGKKGCQADGITVQGSDSDALEEDAGYLSGEENEKLGGCKMFEA
ncbi:uncharacterized protein BDZ99DRAFT_481867 [Mytilinidion resinicola]|uniref:Uncharacterized protein n=1 Tax=Mytilinidion resinicola TaxID=574789 RepID=A0A6A6Y7D9_9PEZI|nr:uncharacterized protein BDZ99DRAFT_481867 [Mytilinidion resinicola]KAF2803894.1 hypothetical protein BDZ99DRAFT_481867 [Mytilinidion resinicola]